MIGRLLSARPEFIRGRFAAKNVKFPAKTIRMPVQDSVYAVGARAPKDIDRMHAGGKITRARFDFADDFFKKPVTSTRAKSVIPNLGQLFVMAVLSAVAQAERLRGEVALKWKDQRVHAQFVEPPKQQEIHIEIKSAEFRDSDDAENISALHVARKGIVKRQQRRTPFPDKIPGCKIVEEHVLIVRHQCFKRGFTARHNTLEQVRGTIGADDALRNHVRNYLELGAG
jgi:hypothetical protein